MKKNMTNKKELKNQLDQVLRDKNLLTADSTSTMKAPASFVEINGEAWPVWRADCCINDSPVYISEGLTAKMAGVPAISTACLCNPLCLARMKNGEAICAHCFAAASLKQYRASLEHAVLNYKLLNSCVLPVDMLPVFGNVRFVRVEWSGDVGSEIQVENYANIARKNNEIIFGWWSKNIRMIEKVFDRIGKPENVILIQSSLKVNEEEEPASKYVDKVFTVYSKEYIKNSREFIVNGENVLINCGARSCVGCRKCYRKDGKHYYIREQLK